MSSKIDFESSYMPKWALPNEGLPLYLTWKNIPFDYIVIEKNEDLVIRDYYNLKSSVVDDKINKNDLQSDGYVGFVFTHPMIEDTNKDIEVKLNFFERDKLVIEKKFVAKIVRPKIEIITPEKIDLEPNKLDQIELKLIYSGYGGIFGKMVVSNKDIEIGFEINKINDLAFLLMNYMTFKYLVKEYNLFENEIELDEIPTDQYSFKKYLTSKIDFAEFKPKDFRDALNKIIQNKKIRKMLADEIIKRQDISNALIDSLINFVENRPVEEVFLINGITSEVEIDKNQKNVYLKLCYLDDFGNLYNVKKTIEVKVKEKELFLLQQEWEDKAGDWKWLKEK